jgi:hypothetical protein
VIQPSGKAIIKISQHFTWSTNKEQRTKKRRKKRRKKKEVETTATKKQTHKQ